MSRQTSRIKLTVILLVAFAALITGLFVSQHMHRQKKIDQSQVHGTLLSQPRPISAFKLTGVDGQSFSDESLKHHWTMVFFGFTNCGYLCPTSMAELGKMYRILEAKGIKNLPEVVMITIDPQRDTVEKLKHYVKAFHPDFYGARGDATTLKTMGRELGVAYAKVALPNAENQQDYDIEHTGAVMLFNPDGQLTAFFTNPHQADLLAQDYELISQS